MVLEVVGHPQSVGHVALHAQAQGFQPLQQQKAFIGASAAPVCLGNVPHPADEAAGPKASVSRDKRLGLGQLGKARRIDPPVDDYAPRSCRGRRHIWSGCAPRCRRRVRWVCTRPGGDRVVDDGRHAAGVGGLGQGGDIDDVAGRVADALAVDRLVLSSMRAAMASALSSGEAYLDPELGGMWANRCGCRHGVGVETMLSAGGGQRLDGVGDGGGTAETLRGGVPFSRPSAAQRTSLVGS